MSTFIRNGSQDDDDAPARDGEKDSDAKTSATTPKKAKTGRAGSSSSAGPSVTVDDALRERMAKKANQPPTTTTTPFVSANTIPDEKVVSVGRRCGFWPRQSISVFEATDPQTCLP